jgi:hypothetical protein
MRSTLVLLTLAGSLLLVGCHNEKHRPKDLTIRDACIYLEQYIVIAVPEDTLATKRASKKQIDHYKAHCK